jgi:hypothetical protein
MNQMIFLVLILVLAIGLPLFFKLSNTMEGYSNYSLAGAIGKFPEAQTEVLVQDIYPAIGKNEPSNESAQDMWWRYPIFEVGSYSQITNNIRYPINPDNATCTPADTCYALYKDKYLGSNYVESLPPVEPNSGTRIGYFTTDDNLLQFRTDIPNILY